MQDEFLDFITQLKNIIQLYKITTLPKITNNQNKIILIIIFIFFQLIFIFFTCRQWSILLFYSTFFFPCNRQNFQKTNSEIKNQCLTEDQIKHFLKLPKQLMPPWQHEYNILFSNIVSYCWDNHPHRTYKKEKYEQCCKQNSNDIFPRFSRIMLRKHPHQTLIVTAPIIQ